MSSTSWLRDSSEACASSSPQYVLNVALIVLPFWFRVCQCLRMYCRTHLRLHLLNALKYSVSISITVVSTLYKKDSSLAFYAVFIALSIVGATFAFVWDIVLDFGLLRSRRNCLLRERLLLPRWSYYVGGVLDLLLRFVWVLSLYSSHVLEDVWGVYFERFLLDIVEWFRRSLWALFRVEN